MSKILYLFILLILISNCSLNKNSKFWTDTKNIKKENKELSKKIKTSSKAINKELNPNLTVILKKDILDNYVFNENLNNPGRINFDSDLQKTSRYKFSTIKNFHQFEPVISSHGDHIVFFDNKGSILKFDEKSNLVWKKNYYSKAERKLNPILQFSNDGKSLVVADNIAKYYTLDLQTGNLIWKKSNLAPFNSQIKIFEDKFFIIDFSNILRCFSIKTGEEIWNVKTEDSLVRSQKKLSMVIIGNKIIFNNSIGDISAVDIKEGTLLWQLPTQSSSIYQSSFSLETSEIISDGKTLFFSNNKNQLFSIDIEKGTFNWKNEVNSSLRSTLIENFLFTVSLEGYLIITDVNTGNIIRITDIFTSINDKKRLKIKPTGFIVGIKKVYVSLNNGKLIIADILTGKIISTLKIDNQKISHPFVVDRNLFVIKDNAIIKLN